MSDPERKKFLEKHRPLEKKGGVGEEIKREKKAKEKYNIDIAEVEKNLTEFLDIKDPIRFNGKVIAMCRRPSMKELKELIPKELQPYLEDPTGLPEDKIDEYDDFFYAKLSELIVVPNFTPKKWKEKANPWFIRLFWEHIASIAKVFEMRIEGF